MALDMFGNEVLPGDLVLRNGLRWRVLTAGFRTESGDTIVGRFGLPFDSAFEAASRRILKTPIRPDETKRLGGVSNVVRDTEPCPPPKLTLAEFHDIVAKVVKEECPRATFVTDQAGDRLLAFVELRGLKETIHVDADDPTPIALVRGQLRGLRDRLGRREAGL